MNLLTSTIGFDWAILFLVHDKQEELRFAQAVGREDDSLQRLKDDQISLGFISNIIAHVAATGTPRFVKNVEGSNLRKGDMILSPFEPRNFAAVSLVARNKVIGVLAGEMLEDKAEIGASDLKLLMTFCNQLAIAVENARLYSDLERAYLLFEGNST